MLFGTWKHLYGIASILFTLLALKRKDSTFLFLGSKCLKVFSLLAFHRMQMGACRPGWGGAGSTVSRSWDAVAGDPSPGGTRRDLVGQACWPDKGAARAQRSGRQGVRRADPWPVFGAEGGPVSPEPSLSPAPGWIGGAGGMMQTGPSSSHRVFVVWGRPASKAPAHHGSLCS